MEFKYRVVAKVSSLEDLELTSQDEHILFKTNNFQEARRECIEWADWDDIYCRVIGRYGNTKFSCNGFSEANERYPKTIERAQNHAHVPLQGC